MRRSLIEQHHEQISVRRQCDLLDISRSGVYYQSSQETEFNLSLMRKMDEWIIDDPNLQAS